MQDISAGLENLPSNGTVSNAVLYGVIAALEAKIEALTAKAANKFSNLDPRALIDMETVAEWTGLKVGTLNKKTGEKRTPDYPPNVKVAGGQIRYRVKDVMDWMADLPRLQTMPLFHYDHEVLGLEAAIKHETEDPEAYPTEVELLPLGEFKHMQLGANLFTEPRQAILPDVAKEFDTATWTLLELTNGNEPRVQALVQGIRNLVESGNDLNDPNNLIGFTVAHVIARYGEKLDIQEVTLLMETLLEKGLNLYQEDTQQKQALDYAEDGSKVQQWDRSRSLSKSLESTLAIKEDKPKKKRDF